MHRKERTNTISLIGAFCNAEKTTQVNHKSVYGSMKTVDFVFVNIDQQIFFKKQIHVTRHINSHVNTDSIWAMTYLITRCKYGASVTSPIIILKIDLFCRKKINSLTSVKYPLSICSLYNQCRRE